MVWFKVDDGLPSSRKVLCIPRSVRLSAIGLWTLAGAWSAGEELDGQVPDYMVTELGGTPRLVDALVKAGLWEEVKSGAQFSNWAEYQPTRTELEAGRAKETERKRRWRERGSHASVPPGQDGGRDPESGHPDPTRPDPLKEKNIVQPTAALKLESDFDSWWALYPRKQGKPDAFKAYKAARKLVDAAKLEAAVQAYLLANIGQDKAFLKMPAGWLRGERWDDEQVASVSLPPRDLNAGMCTIHDGYPLPCRRCGEADF